ncbi:MAG: ECF-type sigma factor [Pseudomonadota bacterium]
MSNATQLLKAWQHGDADSRDALMELLYQELRRKAAGILVGERIALQPTELVNEAYLRLVNVDRIDWQDRAHFLALAATIMRQVLLDTCRRARAGKRARTDVTLATDHLLADDGTDTDFEVLDTVLTELADADAELAQIVELKFFAGLTNTEIGALLNQSDSTIKRRWRTARAWLQSELKAAGAP